MSKQVLIVTGLVLVLLMGLVAPAMATPPSAGDTILVQTMIWSTPNTELSVSGPGIQPNGDCEDGNIGTCP
jgi:hypothetical protein